MSATSNRRADPYQERARQLAIEAGLDPDSRVGEGRGMPLWCTFRDAARQEHVANEAAATAAEIATITPQAERFRDSPLTVFGQHDANTIAQMRNCMSVGNVVAGVICADGHLGYAQPVGGVIAYEKQISISGVGFDSFRHADLLTQISLVMALGLIAFGATPIGLTWAFDGSGASRWAGFALSSLGLCAAGLIIGVAIYGV